MRHGLICHSEGAEIRAANSATEESPKDWLTVTR